MILVKDLLEGLAPHVGDSGVCPDNVSAIIKDLNEVVPMLIKRLDAKGTVFQWCVPASSGCFGLPYDCLEIRTILLDGFPLVQRDQWYEGKLSVGMERRLGANCNQNAFVRACQAQNVIDIGDGFATPEPWPDCNNGKLGLKAENDADADVEVQVVLLNEYGDEITETVKLVNNQQVVPTKSFIKDIKFIRKPVTVGNVIGYFLMPDGRKQKFFTIPPRVVTPQWHRKRLPQSCRCSDHGTVLIRGKARFIPLVSENDVVLIDDLKALQFGSRAIAAMKRDDRQGYNESVALAINELEKQLQDGESAATVGQAQMLSPFGRAAKGRCWA